MKESTLKRWLSAYHDNSLTGWRKRWITSYLRRHPQTQKVVREYSKLDQLLKSISVPEEDSSSQTKAIRAIEARLMLSKRRIHKSKVPSPLAKFKPAWVVAASMFIIVIVIGLWGNYYPWQQEKQQDITSAVPSPSPNISDDIRRNPLNLQNAFSSPLEIKDRYWDSLYQMIKIEISMDSAKSDSLWNSFLSIPPPDKWREKVQLEIQP